MRKFKVIVNLIAEHGKIFTIFLAALYCLGVQQIHAQGFPTPTPKTIEKTPPARRLPMPRPLPTPPGEGKKVVLNESAMPAEKSIATESKVKLDLCILEGNVRINGWERDEVRVYVEDGSQAGFKIVQDGAKTKKPVWLNVLGFDPKKNKEVRPEECLSGSEIELDVPRNATVNLRGSSREIKIESVARVSVESLAGDIFLNDIVNGVEAITYRGDLTVENSSGQIILTNNGSGNVIVSGASPSEIGDILRAKTGSGRIVLRGVEHRVIETNSRTGSTSFDGALLSGGQYRFTATNGSILLLVPQESLCRVNAVFGFGTFGSELPLQNTTKKPQSVSAQLGTEETTCGLNLTTSNGFIRIRKQQGQQ